MEITSTEAQNNFGQYLKLVQFEEIIITKNGKRAAVIKAYEKTGGGTSAVAEKAEAYNGENVKITYEDFLKLSEGSENRYEYIDGEVYLLASPSYAHQRITMEISNVMYNWFKGKSCRPLTAPFDVTLLKEDNKNVVQPDIIVICDTGKIDGKGRYSGVPTLLVEILSETTRSKDMLKKLDLYLYSGVREYWVVSPFNREVYVYFHKDAAIEDFGAYKGNDTVRSVIFEGLEISIEQIFSL